MIAVNLVDVADSDANYGILICDNDDLTVNIIQSKISEIKSKLSKDEDEWVIDDGISKLPIEWRVFLQYPVKRIIVWFWRA